MADCELGGDREAIYEIAMTQLNDEDHNAQMEDMRSFDEQMPCVGIFWYDPLDRALFGVRKKELTPQMVEEAAAKGVPLYQLSAVAPDGVGQGVLPGAGEAPGDQVQGRLHANPPRARGMDH